MSESRLRFFGGILSLTLGLLIMGLKFFAYKLTGSTALLSDALESVVNVAAAGFTLWAVRAAEAPPDLEHPYGHGKIEFVTSVFEGGLITFAALVIGYEAVMGLLYEAPAPNLEQGLWVVVGAGVLNGLLGFLLVAIGRKTSSMALVADGKHVFTDFLTTVGILLGLALVKWTGYAWIDPLIALIMAALLASTGVPLLREAIDALIDAADGDLLRKIHDSLEQHRFPGIIRVHHVRAMRNGRRIHVDGHLVVPEFWSVEEAHDRTDRFEQEVVQDTFLEGEMEFHVDPCRRAYCRICDTPDCPIREQPFESRPPLTMRELLSPVDITDLPKP